MAAPQSNRGAPDATSIQFLDDVTMWLDQANSLLSALGVLSTQDGDHYAANATYGVQTIVRLAYDKACEGHEILLAEHAKRRAA